MVVVLTQIGAAPTAWMAPGLVRVSLNTVVVTSIELCSFLGAGLVAVELSSFDEAGYGVQSMGRLRSDCKELFKALEDMGGLEDGDGSSL